MKKSMKSALCFTMVALMAGTAGLFAQPKPAEGAPLPPPEEKPAERPEIKLDRIKGTVKVSGKGENQTVTVTTSKKKTYVINTLLKKGPCPEDMKMEEEKGPAPEEMKDLPPAPDGEEKEMRKAPDGRKRGPKGKPVSIKSLVEQKGETVVLEGFLNEESNVFTALQYPEKPQPSRDPDLEK